MKQEEKWNNFTAGGVNALRIEGQAVNGKRLPLGASVPLQTPYAITVFPIYACNFRCSYCVHSLREDEHPKVCTEKVMDFSLYQKFIDDLAEFPVPLKVLHFAGLGEPLLHPRIADMVRYAKEKNVAQTVDIVSNGALLKDGLEDDLVRAGLDKIRISLQGLTSRMYKDMSDVEIDFPAFRERLRDLYKKRGDMKIYIKIMDVSLKEYSAEAFYEAFQEMADAVAVEHLCPLVDEISYEENFEEEEFIYTMNGNRVRNAKVCPQPFYSLQVNPDGDLLPCCTIEKPIVIGNCKKDSVLDIWNGETLQTFRKMQLEKKKDKNPVCRKCMQYKYGMFPEDYLDDDAEQILLRCFG